MPVDVEPRGIHVGPGFLRKRSGRVFKMMTAHAAQGARTVLRQSLLKAVAYRSTRAILVTMGSVTKGVTPDQSGGRLRTNGGVGLSSLGDRSRRTHMRMDDSVRAFAALLWAGQIGALKAPGKH